MKLKLKSDEELEWSPIVANNLMNRERNAIGINSYEKDAKIDPIKFILERIDQKNVKWLDLCCGKGNAVIQTAKYFNTHLQSEKIKIIGIDLVSYFNDYDTELENILTFKKVNISYWIPEEKYDLITIVHGLHYIGDKIGLIRKCSEALKKDGIMIGNLDVENIKIENHFDSKKVIKKYFKSQNVDYNRKTKIVKIKGANPINKEFEYIGSDDKTGPNYTGQDSVDSYYRKIENQGLA